MNRQLAFVLILSTSVHARKPGRQKNKANISHVKSNVASAATKVWVESKDYLNLESEDSKQCKENSTPSNSELLPEPNVYIHKFAFNLPVILFLQSLLICQYDYNTIRLPVDNQEKKSERSRHILK